MFRLLVMQGNLLRGIDNYLGVALSVVQFGWKALDNSFSNNFSFQKHKRGHQKSCPLKKNHKNAINLVKLPSSA